MSEIKPGYARVTEILGQWNQSIEDENGNLISKVFVGSNVAIDINVLNNKANLGTNVHKAIEAHLEGMEIPLTTKEKGYFNSFLKWYDQSNCEIVENEKRYYCDKLMVTGCIDALVRFPGSDDLMILDFKTSAQESPKIWPLQAAFYHYLVTSNGGQVCDRLIFLKLDRSGLSPVVFEYKYTPQLLQVCKAAWFCYRYINS